MTALEKYKAALRDAPGKGEGKTHSWLMGTANLAAVAGIDAATAEADLLAAMPRKPNPAGEVRDTIARAYRERGAVVEFGAVPPPSKPAPKPGAAEKSRAAMIQRGGGLGEADLWEMSPVRIDWGDDYWRDAVALLRALFRPGELVFCGDRYEKTVRPVEDWCARWQHGETIPPFLCVNPLKPGGGFTASGHASPRCDDAVAVFRHAVAEFDNLSLSDQINFWFGWGLDGVSAITYSGSKSLHAVLRVDAADWKEWETEVRGGLYKQVLIPMGCDRTCVNPSRLSRLAGARRPDKGGTVQKLLFVRESLA